MRLTSPIVSSPQLFDLQCASLRSECNGRLACERSHLNAISSGRNDPVMIMRAAAARRVAVAFFVLLAMDLVRADDCDTGAPQRNCSAMANGTGSSIPLVTSTADVSKSSRALEFLPGNESNSLSNRTHDLSDVSMDEEDDEVPAVSAKILAKPAGASAHHPLATTRNASSALGRSCEKAGLTYDNGEKLAVDCDLVCTCTNGKMDCVERCGRPYIRKGKKISDPFCKEAPSDDQCCSILQCAADTETEPLELCHYRNKSYNRGDVIQEGCTEVCTCEAEGKLNCKPRCTPTSKTSDKCLEIPDKNDPCCKTVICDVTLKDTRLQSAKYVNASSIKFEFDSKLEPNQSMLLIELSPDKDVWTTFAPLAGGFLTNIDSHYKYARIENTDDYIEVLNSGEDAGGCTHKNRKYQLGEEFNDACDAFCVCKEGGVRCAKLECPTYFGTDVLDPNCVQWETIPANFTPTPPQCCPEKLRCIDNGSCVHEGVRYANWQPIPANVTGCEQRCYCETGKVECQNVCPLVHEKPPPGIGCEPHYARLQPLPDDDCCKIWRCKDPEDNSSQSIHSDELKPGTGNTTADALPLPFPFRPTKAPSRTLGPLTIYENTSPIIAPDENHYGSSTPRPPLKPETAKGTGQAGVGKPGTAQSENEADDTYAGPFNPSYKPKPSKPAKSRPKQPNFVTPPPRSDPNENYIPNEHLHPPLVAPVHIHGKGDPQDILHIINQHPEIADYPPGSVLEIHNVPQRPYHGINNGGAPPGFNFEQILHEIHKNGQNNLLPPSYHSNPSHPGQVFLPAPPHLQNAPTNGRPQQMPPGLPSAHSGAFPNNPSYQTPSNDVNVHVLQAIDAHTIHLAFTVPSVIVGLHGQVEVRYTNRDDADPDSWELQVFAPPNDLIATPHLEFDLVDLRADTEYKIKIAIALRDLRNAPSSRIYKIRTMKAATGSSSSSSSSPKMIPIEPELLITEVNATWASVAWRKFAEYELQFIDGVQLRYKEVEGKIYAATPLIHRAVTNYTLENLKANAKYEVGIFFIPFAGQHTELHAAHMLHFTTGSEVDTYGFNVTLEIAGIKATSVEIGWAGVPYPEDKYVNIFRAIYQSDSGKGDSSTFKVAKRDSPPKTTIVDLKPGTRYRLWLEVYLTNGKIKTSNVQDFITKPRSPPNLSATSKHDKLSGSLAPDKADYYGPLVIVAILAAIAILSTIVLLLILVRRHGQNKACITPPTRVSQSAYDNPTYKVEIQQETMDL